MSRIILTAILFFIFTIEADVVPSKDSLKVYNNNAISATDELFIINEGNETAVLDSVRIVIDEIALGDLSSINNLGVFWRYYNLKDSTNYYYLWYLHEDSIGGYKLISNGGSIPDNIRELAPGDSIAIQQFEIGDCFICSALPRHPSYIKGVLLFYYTNGAVTSIKLYSNDWRTNITKKRHHFIKKYSVCKSCETGFLLNGRKVENVMHANRYELQKIIVKSYP